MLSGDQMVKTMLFLHVLHEKGGCPRLKLPIFFYAEEGNALKGYIRKFHCARTPLHEEWIGKTIKATDSRG
jgi:hypothetical protein